MRRVGIEYDHRPTVAVVDDNAAIREALELLLGSIGYSSRVFASAEEFLDWGAREEAGCLILDVRLPGMSGLQLQRQLAGSHHRTPIVFISGHGDVEMAVQAIKSGAVDFLLKPFREQELLEAVQSALRLDREWRDERRRRDAHRVRYQSLTERERQIMAKVVTGQINKQIAAATGLSEGTVKIHRANVMRKMGADSLADLVRVADLLTLATADLEH